MSLWTSPPESFAEDAVHLCSMEVFPALSIVNVFFALGTLQFPVAPTVALSNAGDVEYFEPPAPISPKSRNRGGMHRTLCMSCLKPLPPPLDGESESDMCICPPTTFFGGTSSSKSDSSSSGHKSIPKIAARTPMVVAMTSWKQYSSY